MRYSVFVRQSGKLVHENDNLERVRKYIERNRCASRTFLVFDNYKKKFLKYGDYQKSKVN